MSDPMITCSRAEALRDYAFDELFGDDRRSMEQHIHECDLCAAELDQLRVTTAALRILPDVEIPQRIAFVSDKIFTPSIWSRLFGPGLGFLSAAVLAGALIVFAYHRPVEIRTVVQASTTPVDVSRQINDAVAKAVAQVHSEDVEMTRAALGAAEVKHQQEHRALVEMITVMQDHANTRTLLASSESQQAPGAGQ